MEGESIKHQDVEKAKSCSDRWEGLVFGHRFICMDGCWSWTMWGGRAGHSEGEHKHLKLGGYFYPVVQFYPVVGDFEPELMV